MSGYRFKALSSLSEVGRVVQSLRGRNKPFALDIETTEIDSWRNKIVGVGLCWSEKGAVYVPIRHRYDQPFDSEKAIQLLRPLLLDYQFIAFNAVFELEFFEHDWMLIPKVQPIDACLLTYVEGKYDFQKLDTICKDKYPSLGVLSFNEFMGHAQLAKRNSIDEAPVPLVADYCGRDTLACFLLYRDLYEKFKDHPIYKLEKAVFPEVVKLRRNGVLINPKFFQEERLRIEEELANLQKVIETEVSEKAKEPIGFNIGSPKQLGVILYDVLKFPCKRQTKTGGRSTNKDTLNTLRWKHPIVRNIITYKELNKRLTTYYRKYPAYVQKDGRIHASYNQTGVVTGRFSCSDPNLQNIPGKASWMIERPQGSYNVETDARVGFIVSPDSLLVEFDYSQVEARIAAGVTREPVLLNAFAEGIDFHTKTASLVYSVPLNTVTKDQRFMGKKLNFALSYGMGTDKLFHTLREDIDVGYEQAKKFRKRYLDAYPTMFHEAEMIAKGAERAGFVKTIWGRKIPMRVRGDESIKMFHEAYNYKIQGSAGDLLKVAMIRVGKHLREHYMSGEALLILTTHDSLTFQVANSVDLEQFIDDMLGLMYHEEKGYPPFIAEVEVGRNWGDLLGQNKGEETGAFVQRVGVFMDGEQKKEVIVDKTFVLEIPSGEGRTTPQLEKLRGLLKENPGQNEVILKIGEIEKLLAKTSLGIQDRQKILLIFGGKFYERL